MKKQLPDEALRKQIRIQIQRSTGAEAVKLPKDIYFTRKGDTLVLSMQRAESLGWGEGDPEDMTKNNAAFEAWSLALYVHYLKCFGRVSLDIPDRLVPEDSITTMAKRLVSGDYSKKQARRVRCWALFLYRALRFSRLYSWFSLSPRLQKLVAPLDGYLKAHSFTNSAPAGKPHARDEALARIERRFADRDSDQLSMAAWGEKGSPQLHLDLPCHLYQEKAVADASLFPVKGASVDMWTRRDDTLCLFEIKPDRGSPGEPDTPRIGILTKLCFLASYAYDMYAGGEPSFHPETGPRDRGYSRLTSGGIQKVEGYLLLDKAVCHPLLDQALFRIMEDHKGCPNAPALGFGLLIYETRDGKVGKVYRG